MSYKDEVKLAKALADENRLAILKMLKNEEKCACVLLEELDITQPTLSHHMKILCESGLVDSCRDGKWMHYSLSFDGSRKLREMADRYTISETDMQNYRKCSCCE